MLSNANESEVMLTPEQNTAKNCVNCERPDTADDLVQCDDCQDWWHWSCAGVTGSISERPWCCRTCLPVSILSRTTTSSVRANRLRLKLQQLEEKQSLEKRHLEERHKLQEESQNEEEDAVSNRSRSGRSIAAVRQWQIECAEQSTGTEKGQQEEALVQQGETRNRLSSNREATNLNDRDTTKEVPPVSVVNKGGVVEPNVYTKKQQRFNSALSGTVPKMNATFRNQQLTTSAIPTATKKPGIRSSTVSHQSPPCPDVQGKPLCDPIANKDLYKCSTNVLPNKDSLQQLTHQFSALGNIPALPNSGTSGMPADANVNTVSQHKVTNAYENQNLNIGTIPSSSGCPNTNNVDIIIPSPSQLAARQVMSRDLPIFTGNPIDWPIFISSFQNTSLACGYNSAENLARLQRCLRGPAFESVKSRLLLPESVPHVIDTLRLLYGRPELLISALLKSVRSVAAPKAEKIETLIDYGIAVRSLCDHMEAAGQQEHLSNPSLLMELVEKLPVNTKLQWAEYMQKQPVVNLKTFGEFMQGVITAVSRVTMYTGVGSSTPPKQKHRGVINTHSSEADVKPEPTRDKQRECSCCKKNGHKVGECSKFKSFSLDDRWKLVKGNGLCRSCLNAHGRRNCRTAKQCVHEGCQYRHHPLLHTWRSHAPQLPRIPVVENHTHLQSVQQLMFRIIPVFLCGPRATIETFAFLDDGSSLSLIEDSLVEQLGIDGWAKPLCLKWTGSVTRVESNSKQVRVHISGTNRSKQFTLNDVRTVKELTLPQQSLQYDDLAERYKHLKGLPVASYKKAVPRMLIGVNHVNLTVPLQVREGRANEPIAVKTRLGWCIFGGRDKAAAHALNYHACDCTNDEDLHNLVRDYFATEDVSVKPAIQLESKEDTRARNLLKLTTVRVGNRYETGLLWRYDRVELPDSYKMAAKRFECLERKMVRDPQLATNVKKQIEDYQTKGYAHCATSEELELADPKRVWYLPLGVVTNPRKPEKFRLIWDAAASVNGISLNTMLLKGPDLLTSLPAVLCRFRQFQVGVSADIKEMFHQIMIRKQDQQSQRFLWRNDPSEPLKIMVMDVAIFGSTCSPTSAQYVKNLNATEFADRFPRAVQGIHDNHYVDDFLDSFESTEEAAHVSKEIRCIHQHGGFHLRNWLSNDKAVLNELKEEHTLDNKTFSLTSSEGNERVLGLLWSTANDKLKFSMQLKPEIQVIIERQQRPTKRQMLKCLMGIFDPLGLLSVFMIHGKILLQDVWREGLQWDEKVTDGIYERWDRWTKLFPLISELQIPRCYFPEAHKKTYNQLQLHVFVDASEAAYAAVAYFRIVNSEGKFQCALAAAKTKVAPLKPLSIPRLELQAAVLGCRLATFVQESHTVEIKQRFLWSDSATVLAWLRDDHRRYKQYVACRIGEIITATNVNEWRWIPSKLNPADMATKWTNRSGVDTANIWSNGPEFLRGHEDDWPKQTKPFASTKEELRPCYVIDSLVVPECIVDFQRFSKWTKLLNTLAYVRRFLANCRRAVEGKPTKKSSLEREELQEAKNTVIRMVQWQEYADEMICLSKGTVDLKRFSSLRQLSPKLDDSGVLRVDGRIGAARFAPFDARYPVILPRKHYVTKLIVEDFHKNYLHGNSETVVNEIRQFYHIPRLRTVVKQVATTCQWCKVNKAQPKIPRMGSLPAARLAPFTRPFTYVGVDLFGPLLVKVGRSAAKRWICLMTCLTTRAVHVEVVHSLSTSSCVKSIRRFVCRRGSPSEIYSDNGTNFQGAERLLREQVQKIEQEAAETFTNVNTRWLFIPPAAPHMGGAWERMVRSIKTAMLAANSTDRKLDDEGLQTLIVEAEGIVNSRPLTYLPLDAEEVEALSPNHFLLGSSNGIRQPAAEFTNPSSVVRDSWYLLQHQLDIFWKRWIKEYLPVLTKRTKWFGEVKPVAVGDLVLIVEEGKRNDWRRGRVKEVVVAKDGRVRQAIIQTARGMLRRPVSKLAVLEVESGSNTGSSGQYYGGECCGWELCRKINNLADETNDTSTSLKLSN